MTDALVRLPWPPSKTSKNGSQGDFIGKAKAAKSYKATCAWECKVQAVPQLQAEGDVTVVITYHPPRRGRVDWDNLAARCKQGFDAVAEHVGIDDGRWWPVACHRGEPVKGGAVLVHIKTEAGAWRSIGELVQVPIIGEIT
jgi:hypothetical protein